MSTSTTSAAAMENVDVTDIAEHHKSQVDNFGKQIIVYIY